MDRTGGETNKVFFQYGGKNFNQKTITELETSEGIKITDPKEILQEIEHFYQVLYQSEYAGSHELFADFVHSLQLPKLSDDDKENLEGELTIPECRQILKTFNFGKSPGEDGFTVEFYIKFFELLAFDLVESLNTAYSRGQLSISQRRGVVTLIPKADSDTLKLTNWRPITLLNVDYKIASKAIATRIKKVLPHLIHCDQTGFMKDRFIGQNVRLLCDLLEQTELENIPGILLQLDFRKAFDTIEWPMIQQVLSIFNFGASIKRWIEAFYCKAESSVINNGFTTRQLELSRGVRQGCPLSPYLFILSVEILATKIRQDNSVCGIFIFHKELKISQFADDTSLICSNLLSVHNALLILNEFGILSGLKLNESKTKAVWLGPWKQRTERPFNFLWTKEPLKVLGIHISYDKAGNERKNVNQKIDNLNAMLGSWRSRQLSIFERCLIVKSLGISQIVHSAAVLDIHKDNIVKVQSLIFKFIWKDKQDKIKREVLYQDYERGGLRVTHVETLCKALRLAWIQRFLKGDSRRTESWKVIPCSFFKKYGGLYFLLHCNFDENFLKSIEMPAFYKQILSFFLELKTIYDTNGDHELILFNNKEIKIGGKTVFYQDWFDQGVFSVCDILDSSGMYLNFADFCRKFSVKCNFLTYFQVLSAIPKRLLGKARESFGNNCIFNPGNSTFHLSPSLLIDLSKITCKDYYWLFLNRREPCATGPSKWQRDLPNFTLSWNTIFKRIKSISKQNKLKEFFFKLAHRIITTKKELHLYGIEDNKNCHFCGDDDSLLHTFLDCQIAVDFFRKVLCWFNEKENSSIILNFEEMLFGAATDNDGKNKKLNFCLLYAKFYFHFQKINHRECIWDVFVQKLIYMLKIEGLA